MSDYVIQNTGLCNSELKNAYQIAQFGNVL